MITNSSIKTLKNSFGEDVKHMGLQPNMWTVANHMEQIYMATGSIPSMTIVQSEFPDIDDSELDAGEMLFYEKIGQRP